MQFILFSYLLRSPQILLYIYSCIWVQKFPCCDIQVTDIFIFIHVLKCYVKSIHKKFQQKTVYFSLLQKFLFFLLVLHFTYCAWLTENKLREIKIEFITFLLESATPVFSPWVSKVKERNLAGIIVHVVFQHFPPKITHTHPVTLVYSTLITILSLYFTLTDFLKLFRDNYRFLCSCKKW